MNVVTCSTGVAHHFCHHTEVMHTCGDIDR